MEPEPEPEPDTTPPQTRITRHPSKVVLSGRRHRRVSFRFASSEEGSRFRCKLDSQPYRSCGSPRVFGVYLGAHAVRVVAVDAAGNADPTPALFRFRVKRTGDGALALAPQARRSARLAVGQREGRRRRWLTSAG